MSYLHIMELLQKHCDEDPEIADLLEEIDLIERDNKEIERQLQELDSENVRLQMEVYKIEQLTSQVDHDAIAKSYATNIKIFGLAVDMRNLINKIDFEKILKCHYMEMEEKYRKEMEPLQECMQRTLKWHEKMEQRYVVQRYRQAEKELSEAKAICQAEKESIKKSLKESNQLISDVTLRRNEIIVNLIHYSKEVNRQREEIEKLNAYEEYIEGLKKEKMELLKQLEEQQHKTFNFNPIVPYKPQDQSNESSGNLANFNFAMPKLPSFTDILTDFKTKCQKQTEVVFIQNTTCIKSILHNSQNNSMELNQSITTKLTKQVRFKVPLEEYQEDVKKDNTEYMESEDNSSESSQQTIVEINEIKENEDEEEEEEEEMIEETEEIKTDIEIETIDLLTPAEAQGKHSTEAIESPEKEHVTTKAQEEEKENVAPNKPKVEIQECIIFKAPLPVGQTTKLECKENSFKTSSTDESISSKVTTSRSSANTFYDAFLKASLSPDFSSTTKSQTKIKTHSKRSVLKDFDKYVNETKDFSIDFKPSAAADQTEAVADEDMFDFGSSQKMGFLFDSSDDNMGENTESNVFDFMN